jgi:hypothetical protein
VAVDVVGIFTNSGVGSSRLQEHPCEICGSLKSQY